MAWWNESTFIVATLNIKKGTIYITSLMSIYRFIQNKSTIPRGMYVARLCITNSENMCSIWSYKPFWNQYEILQH